ncbi:MAG: 50S ribosomal protein L22 [Candidatus Muiribacteriota bacterium]
MENTVRAIQKHIRISPLKMNQVMKEIRGKKAEHALNILKLNNKKACYYLTKLINSAVANAVNNHSMDADRLYISEIYSNEGPTLKRIQPQPMGRAFRINKRTCHNTVILKEVQEEVKTPVKPEKNEKKATKAKAEKETAQKKNKVKSESKKSEKAEVVKEEN